MTRLLLSLLILSTLVSCRGDKSTAHAVQSSMNGPAIIVPMDSPFINEDDKGNQSTSGIDPVSQTTGMDTMALLNSQIVASIKILNSMLGNNSDNTVRMEGIVITNYTPNIKNRVSTNSVIDSIPNNLLFAIANKTAAKISDAGKVYSQSTPNCYEEQSAKLVETHRFNLNCDLKARLVTRDVMTDTQKAETEKAYNKLIEHPENYSNVPFPVSLYQSRNFFQKDGSVIKTDFRVQIRVDQEKLKAGSSDFLSFELTDQDYNHVGKAFIYLPIASQNTAPKLSDYKMTLQFIAPGIDNLLEQVAILQMAPITIQSAQPN